jgi:hypothetical protein
MAIPRRWSRPITVDGQPYRWLVRGKPTYCQSMGWSPLTVAVGHGEGGSVMVVTLPQPHPDSRYNTDQEAFPVLPSDVAWLIRAGQAAGWNPTQPGCPFPFTAPARNNDDTA